MSQRRAITYSPQPETADILRRAFLHIESVPYKVSIRWVFYRLLQEGFYSSKDDYKKLINHIGRARHAFWEGWRPDTLADETRSSIIEGDAFESVEAWIKAPDLCVLDKWQDQDSYLEIWFEARAMVEQFKEYTKYITLRPMGGQPSIPFKFNIAKDLDAYEDRDVTILYFGDLDPAGRVIANVASEDVHRWSDCDFDFVWAGLTSEQVDKYRVPENFEHPGAYQWEALADDAAAEIIHEILSEYVDQEAIDNKIIEEVEATVWMREQQKDLIEKWQNKELF